MSEALVCVPFQCVCGVWFCNTYIHTYESLDSLLCASRLNDGSRVPHGRPCIWHSILWVAAFGVETDRCGPTCTGRVADQKAARHSGLSTAITCSPRLPHRILETAEIVPHTFRRCVCLPGQLQDKPSSLCQRLGSTFFQLQFDRNLCDQTKSFGNSTLRAFFNQNKTYKAVSYVDCNNSLGHYLSY